MIARCKAFLYRVDRDLMSGRYIPNLARFYFKPDLDWSIDEARELHDGAPHRDVTWYEDCVEGMKRLGDGSVNLVIADPPFGIGFSGNERFYNRDASLVRDGYGEVDAEQYSRFTRDWIAGAYRVLDPSGSMFVFSGFNHLKDVLLAIDDAGFSVVNHVIWVYQFPVYCKKKWAVTHYHLIFAVKEDGYFYNCIEHYDSDVWTIPRKYARGEKKNGTKLPVDLVRKCINFTTRPGDLVLDPFLGNGTTFCAARGEYRHFVGFEINANMKDIIEDNVSMVKPGCWYVPYVERLPSIKELASRYPAAHREYIRKENEDGGKPRSRAGHPSTTFPGHDRA